MESSKNKAKPLKLGKNDIICPSCNTVLNISEELQNDQLIQCPKCEAAINNPFYFSGKFVLCSICGTNLELPRDIANELIIHCTACNQDIYNPHSDKCNLIICPHCQLSTHVPDELLKERYFQCLNCKNFFKNSLRQKTNININEQSTINSTTQHNLQDNQNEANIDEQLILTKKQQIWLASLLISVVVLIVLFSAIIKIKDGENFEYSKTGINMLENFRSPEIIYTEIKKALKDELPETCKSLYKEMQTNYPTSNLFDSVEKVYDSAMFIAKTKKEAASEIKKKYNAEKIEKNNSIKNNKHLNGQAGAYTDGVLSCNLYLLSNDNKKSYYLDANSITYKIVNSQGTLIKPIGESTTAKTESGLFIDIPLGNLIYQAKSISFVITINDGTIYKLNDLNITWD